VAIGKDLHLEGIGPPLFWAVGQVLALGIAMALSRRRGDRFGMWIAAMCGTTALIAFAATFQIRDRIIDHEIFWMSALGVLNGGVIAGGLVSFRRPGRVIVSAVCIASFLVVTAAGVTGIRHALQRSRTIHSVDVLTDEIQRTLREGNVRPPLFHIEHSIWPVAAGALLRLHKAGISCAVDDRWVTMFGEAFKANGQEDAQLTIAGSIRMPRLLN
jgi:4-amino-4-deoxy-L-arabinose transferase-like glycosyltransferase